MRIVPYLNYFTNLNIITNELFVTNEIINQSKHNCIVYAEKIQPNTNSILGPLSISTLNKFHADITLISCGGLDYEFYLSKSTIESAKLKRSMIKNSTKTICLVDSSKFDKQVLYKTCDILNINTLITTKELTPMDVEYFKSRNVKVII